MSWENAVLQMRLDPAKAVSIREAYLDEDLTTAAARYFASDEWREVQRVLGNLKGKRVLDVGGGRGFVSAAFALAGAHTTILEPDDSTVVGLGAARPLFRHLGCDVAEITTVAETIPAPDASFDIIFGRCVLHHIEGLPQFGREAFRLLAPQGRALFLREHVISQKEDLTAFLDSHPAHALFGGENAYLLKEYREAFLHAGFVERNVWSPVESVLSAYPVTYEGLERSRFHAYRKPVQDLLRRFIGCRLSHKISSNKRVVNALAGKVRPIPDDTPGRVYSFLYQKQ